MKKIKFENGTLVSNAKVEIGGTIYDVTPEQYEGTTPLSASNMNAIQDNAEEAIKEVATTLEQLTTDVENKHTYSTEEVVVGTYMGKAKYRKTIVMSNVTETNKTYDLSSLSVETCMINSSHSYFEQGNYQIPIGCYGGTTDYSRAFYQKNTKTLYVQFGTTYTMSKNIHITIEYTKTTDSVV